MGGHTAAASGGSKIKWGTIVAGAAIATGAVLFAPSLMDKIPEIAGGVVDAVQGIGAWIAGAVGGAAASAPSAGGGLAEALTSPMAQKAAGLALMAGGAAHLMNRGGEPEHAHHHHRPSEGFAMREDMRKMQAKMLINAAAAGHPQAQAMLAQQTGRG